MGTHNGNIVSRSELHWAFRTVYVKTSMFYLYLSSSRFEYTMPIPHQYLPYLYLRFLHRCRPRELKGQTGSHRNIGHHLRNPYRPSRMALPPQEAPNNLLSDSPHRILYTLLLLRLTETSVLPRCLIQRMYCCEILGGQCNAWQYHPTTKTTDLIFLVG